MDSRLVELERLAMVDPSFVPALFRGWERAGVRRRLKVPEGDLVGVVEACAAARVYPRLSLRFKTKKLWFVGSVFSVHKPPYYVFRVRSGGVGGARRFWLVVFSGGEGVGVHCGHHHRTNRQLYRCWQRRIYSLFGRAVLSQDLAWACEFLRHVC